MNTKTKTNFLLNGARLKLSFQEVECDVCGHVNGEYVCRPIDQYAEELQGAWVALVPAENNRHLSMEAPTLQATIAQQAERIKELEAAIKRMRTAGGKNEFQKAFDAAKELL